MHVYIYIYMYKNCIYIYTKHTYIYIYVHIVTLSFNLNSMTSKPKQLPNQVEVYVRYMILRLVGLYGTIALVALKSPTVEPSAKPMGPKGHIYMRISPSGSKPNTRRIPEIMSCKIYIYNIR